LSELCEMDIPRS